MGNQSSNERRSPPSSHRADSLATTGPSDECSNSLEDEYDVIPESAVTNQQYDSITSLGNNHSEPSGCHAYGHPWDSNETCSKVYLQGNHTYRLRSHSFECPRDTQSHDIQLPESYPRESYMSRARTYRDTSHETNTTGRPLTGKRHRFSCDATHEADTTGHPPTGKLLAEQSTASNKLPSQITAAFNEDCIIHPRDLKLYDEQLLGQGSYGQVLKARYRGTPCAAKRLHHIFRELLPGNRRMLENFIQECQKLSHIRHPKIVQFLGVQFDEETNVPLLVMERMECSLTSVLDSSQFLPMSTKLSIALDISQALAYLHSCDPPIVHRDLSSNNILLTANMEAKIADLGVSRYQTPADSGVQCTQCPGSLLYMAPEALTANPECNSAIDIFSYGVLLLQIITQNPPNPTPAGQEVDRRRNDLEQMQLELQEWGGLEDVRSLIYECLSNDPLKRPRALDICELLEKVQVSDPEREKPKLGLAKGNSLFSPISIILQPRPPLYSTQDPFPKSSTSQQCKVQSLVVPQQPQSQQHESSTQEANRQETTEQLLPGTIPVSTPYDDSSSEEQGASHAEQLSVESTPENESGTQEGEMVVCVHNRLHIVSRKQESSINNKASTVLSAIQTQSSDTECSAQAKREDSKMISDEESTGIPNQKASLQGAKSGSAESDVVHTATASSQVPKDSENQPNSKHRTTNIHPTNSLSNAHESPVFTLESSPHNGVQPSSHNTHSLEEDMTTTVLSGTFASNPDIHSPQKPDMWKLMPLTHRPYFLYCLQVSREEEMKWKYWNFSAFLNQSHFQTSLHHLVKRMNVLQWQFENGTPSIPRLQPSHTTRANSSQMVATEVPEPADVAVNEALRRSLILTGSLHALDLKHIAVFGALLAVDKRSLRLLLHAYVNSTLVCGYTASHMIVQKYAYKILDDDSQPSGFPPALPHSSTLTKIQSAHTTDQFKRLASCEPQQQSRLSSTQSPISQMLIIEVPESVDRGTEINSPESLILTTCKTKFDLAFTVADLLSNVLLRWLHNRPSMLQWPFENGTPSIPRLQSSYTTRANSSHVVAMEAPEPAVVVVNEALRKNLVLTGSLRALDHKHIAAFQINAYKILDDMQPPAPSGFPPALPNSLSANTTDQFKLHASYGSQQQSGLSRTIGQVFAMEILELAIHEASLIGPASTLNFTALLAYANNTLVCGYTASHMIVQKYAYKILDDDTQPSGFPPALPHSSTLTKIQSAHTTDQFKRFASFGPQQQSSAQPPIVQMLTVEVPESVDKTTEINCPESLILTTCKAKPYGKILLGSLHNRPFMLQWRFKNGTSSIPRLQSPHTTCTSSSHVVAMEAPEPADVTVNEAFRRSLIVHLVSLHTFALHYTTSQSIVQKYAIKFLDNTQCGFPKALPHSLSLKKLQSASLSDQFTKLCRASRGSQQQSNLSGTLSPNSEKISPEAQSTALSMKDSKTMLPTQAEVETETTLCISEDHICNHVGTGNTMCQSQLIPYYADSFWINACYLTNLCTLPCAVGMQLSKYPYLELNSQSTTPEKPFYTLPNPSNDSGVQRKDAYLPEHSTSQTHSLPREVGPRDGQAMKLQFRGQLAKTSCLETDSNFWFHLWKLMPLRHRPFFLYCLQVSREEEMKWKCWNMVIVRPHQTFTTNHSLIAFSAFLNQSSLHHLVKRMNVLQWQFENGTPIESTDIAVNEVLRLILIGLVQIAAFTAIGKRLKSIVFQQHDYVVYVYFQFLSRSQYISVLLKYATPFLVDSLPLCNNTNHVLGAIEPQDSSCAAVKQPWSTVTKHSKSQTALITTTFTRPMSMVSSNGNCQYWNLKYLLQSLSRFQNCNDNIRGYTALKHATKFLTLPTAFPLSFGQRTSLQSASVKDQIKVLINLCTSLGGLCMQTGNYPYMSTYYYTTPEKPFYTLPNQSNDSGVQHKDAYLSEQSTSQTHSLRLCPDPREVDPRDDKALTTDAIMETTSTNFKPHKLLSVYKSMTPDTHRNTHYHCIIMEHLSQGNSFCLLLQLSYDIHNVVNGGGILAVINIIPNSSPNSKSLTAFVMATLFNNSQTQRSSLILCDHNHRHMLDRHGEQQDSSIYISASVPPKWLASLVSQRGIQQLPYSSPWSKHSLMQPCQNKETFLILQNSLIVDNPEIATLIKPNESLNVRHSFSPVLSCSKSSTQTICSYLPPPLIPPMGKIRPSIKGIKITTCPGNSNGGQSGSGSGTGSTGSSSGGSSGNVPAPGGGAGGVGGSSCGGGAGGGDNGDKDDKDKDKNPPWDPDKGEEEEISPSVEEIVTPSSSNTLKDDDTVTETRDPSNLPPDSESEDEEHQHQTHFHIKDHGGKPATKGDVEGEDSTNDKRVPAADQLGKTANSDSHEQSTLPQNPHDGLEGMHTDQHGGSNCDMSDSQSSTDTAELTLESSASPAGPEGNSLAVNQNLPLPLPPPVHQHNHKHPSQHSFLSVANGDDNDSASSTDMFQNAQAEDSCQGIHNEVLVTGLSHHSYSPFHADVDLAESDDYIPSTPMAPQPFQSLAGCEADIQSNNESPTTQKYSSATVGVTVGDLTNVTTPLPETSSQPAQQLVSGLSSSWCTVQNVEVQITPQVQAQLWGCHTMAVQFYTPSQLNDATLSGCLVPLEEGLEACMLGGIELQRMVLSALTALFECRAICNQHNLSFAADLPSVILDVENNRLLVSSCCLHQTQSPDIFVSVLTGMAERLLEFSHAFTQHQPHPPTPVASALQHFINCAHEHQHLNEAGLIRLLTLLLNLHQ